MKLISVNVSMGRTVPYRGREVVTGIFKEPVTGRVKVHGVNIDGDAQADPRCHGGPNKAVYAYPLEHYTYWSERLSRADLRPGQFGENLTTAGLSEEETFLGDVFRVGTARLLVTQSRVPCFKLALKMGDAKFPDLFLESGRTGMYFGILEEGEIGAGDTIELLERGASGVSLRDLWSLAYGDLDDPAKAAKVLELTTLGPEWLHPIEKRLSETTEE